MLNESKGNMYDFVTHTWNPIKGKCSHDCLYCYMKRYGEQKPLYLDKKELKTDLGSKNFIFLGSSTDMFSKEVNPDWIDQVMEKCKAHDNRYLLQTKNPEALMRLKLPKNFEYCTTIETNRVYPQMGNTPRPGERASAMACLHGRRHVTIEPIMDFDLEDFLAILRMASPDQVNIGSDSGNNGLPEPGKDKLLELIYEISKFSIVAKKVNMERLLK